MVRRNHRKLVTDSSVINIPTISDHRMVLTSLKLNFTWRKTSKAPKRMDLKRLKEPEILWSFKRHLSKAFEDLEASGHVNTENVDEEFSAFKTWISEAAAKTIPMKSNFQPNWMDEVARQAIEQKAKMRKQYGCESLEYKNTHKKAKNCIKTAKENYIMMKCEQLNALKGDIYFFEVMKEIRRGQKTTGWRV